MDILSILVVRAFLKEMTPDLIIKDLQKSPWWKSWGVGGMGGKASEGRREYFSRSQGHNQLRQQDKKIMLVVPVLSISSALPPLEPRQEI